MRFIYFYSSWPTLKMQAVLLRLCHCIWSRKIGRHGLGVPNVVFGNLGWDCDSLLEEIDGKALLPAVKFHAIQIKS